LEDDLENKVVVVTGAHSGIGKATAERIAAAGAIIVVTDIEDCEATVEAIRASEGAAIAVKTDVRNEEQVKFLFAKVAQEQGRLDVLINCAGVVRRRSILDTSLDDWNWMVDVNLKGTFLCCREAVKLMRGHGGVIVNVASELAIVAAPITAVYSATKAGVVQLTRSIAVDHGVDGIRANCVCPGPIDTPMLQQATAEDIDPVRKHRANIDATILHRIGKPEEIASVIYFLASGLSSFLTGSVVVADGGVSAK
jgi:NAD(P)-dependent dehydrogenase (short-subunit alcohol dehydrogenase family)